MLWTKIKLIFARLSPLMLEYLEAAAVIAVDQILPIVLEIVIKLITEKLTGTQKQQLAFKRVKAICPAAQDEDINNAIEVAYKIAVKRGLVPGKCPDGKC